MPLVTSFRKLLFGLSPEQATFARRGFRATRSDVQQHLERIGKTFIWGYHEALALPSPEALPARLNEAPRELLGFAFEGAAMGLVLLDGILPGRPWRFRDFLAGEGGRHAYMAHVGAGWAIARLPWLRRKAEAWLKGCDAHLGWLVVDGYGFHEGFFHGARYYHKREQPKRLSRYGLRAFDQGLGRGLWFFAGADVEHIAETIRALPAERHADLFSGVGLASAYAGGVQREAIVRLRDLGKDYASQLAQGAAFAAKARQRAGNPAEHTEVACQVLCGMPADQAAAITDDSLADTADEQGQPAYEAWRLRIQQQFAGEDICHA